MSALAKVREKFGSAQTAPCKTCRSPDAHPSEGFAGPQDEHSQLFAALRPRIEEMAQRWMYTSDELAEVLQLARQDPVKWELAASLDERLCQQREVSAQ